MVYMDKTAVTRVDPVSMTPSVTTLTEPVYRGVVLGIRETSVQKVTYYGDLTEYSKLCICMNLKTYKVVL